MKSHTIEVYKMTKDEAIFLTVLILICILLVTVLKLSGNCTDFKEASITNGCAHCNPNTGELEWIKQNE